MGNYSIVIEGVGPHHNKLEIDAEAIAAVAVRELAKYGTVMHATVHAGGGKVDLLERKQEISQLIDEVYRHCGQKETVIFCDRIMGLGFYHAFKAGISFGKDDMLIPDTKTKIVAETTELVRECMTHAVPLRVPLQVDARAAGNWDEAH